MSQTLANELYTKSGEIDPDVPEGRGADRLHLVRTARDNAHYGINKPCEWFCNICRCRVTVTPDMDEMGHHNDCPHRPDELPAGNTRGRMAARINRVCPACGGREGDHLDACPNEDWTCPTCEADGFASRRGMKSHHARAHQEPLKDRGCKTCGIAFATDDTRQRFCSHECATDASRKTETRACELCEEDFDTKPSSSQRFCSHGCAAIGCGLEHRTGESRECEECGEEFYRHPTVDGPFCSTKCYLDSRRETRECEWCGEDFEAQKVDDQRFCCHDCQRESLADSRRKREHVDCQNCGEDIERIPSSDRKFCDRECYNAHRRGGSDGGDA